MAVIYVLSSLSVLIILTYVLAMAFKYGIQDFVSDDYYASKHKWLFTAVLVLSGLLLLPGMFEANEDLGGLALFGGLGLCFVGLEPHYKSSGKLIHSIGAYSCFGFWGIWSIVNAWYILLCTTILFGILYILSNKKHPWWYIECASIGGCMISALYTIFFS